MKKTVLVAINAKFIHSNLALRYMQAYYVQEEGNEALELLEYSINQEVDYILSEVLGHQPEVVAFSCYLWNIDMVRKLAKAIKQVSPKVIIVYGGPEVMYNGREELEGNDHVDYVINGEGEETFRALITYLNSRDDLLITDDESDNNGLKHMNDSLDMTSGLTYRKGEDIVVLPPSPGLDMARIPFPYDDDLEGLDHRILYYETSRGCPFNCQYCLSSIEKGVRFRPLDMVFMELDFFLNKKVKQVKFVDRTFNAKKEHALGIMSYVIEHDNGVTNFHFEVSPELIRDEFIELLSKARKGLFQLEVGVQSTNEETLNIIKRHNKMDVIEDVVKQVHQLGNTHMHLDLIAGLPRETYNRFGESFDFVYSLRPDQLQLGFLKVLKGSGMMSLTSKYGIIYRNYPPYEVLKTENLDFFQLEQLKIIEEMVELFYNSGQFQMTIEKYIGRFDSAFKGFEQLALEWISKGNHHRKHQKLDLFKFLYEVTGDKELLMYDYCLNEKPKKTSEWMDYTFIDGSKQRFFLDTLKANGIWIKESESYTTKQLSRMYHMDQIKGDLPTYFNDSIKLEADHEEYSGTYLIVNYNRRDFIHNNGESIIITI